VPGLMIRHPPTHHARSAPPGAAVPQGRPATQPGMAVPLELSRRGGVPKKKVQSGQPAWRATPGLWSPPGNVLAWTGVVRAALCQLAGGARWYRRPTRTDFGRICRSGGFFRFRL